MKTPHIKLLGYRRLTREVKNPWHDGRNKRSAKVFPIGTLLLHRERTYEDWGPVAPDAPRTVEEIVFTDSLRGLSLPNDPVAQELYAASRMVPVTDLSAAELISLEGTNALGVLVALLATGIVSKTQIRSALEWQNSVSEAELDLAYKDFDGC